MRCSSFKFDELVKNIRMAKLKVPYRDTNIANTPKDVTPNISGVDGSFFRTISDTTTPIKINIGNFIISRSGKRTTI